jgi:hypothetical protein
MRAGTRVRRFDGSEVRVVAVRTPERVLLAPWRTSPPLIQVAEWADDPVWMHPDAVVEVLAD